MLNLRVFIINFLIDINEFIFIERRFKKEYKKIKLNTIIDVGANKGQSIRFFKNIYPNCEIYAFEPTISLFTELEKNYKNSKSVKVYNEAISDIVGEKKFYENTINCSSSLEEINYNSDFLKFKSKVIGIKSEKIISKEYLVKTNTLSNFINNLNKDIDLIKIDVEGHEYQCVKGLFDNKIKNKIKYIQLEKRNDDMYPNKIGYSKIEELLLKNNFKVLKIFKHGFGNLIEEILFYNSLMIND